MLDQFCFAGGVGEGKNMDKGMEFNSRTYNLATIQKVACMCNRTDAHAFL